MVVVGAKCNGEEGALKLPSVDNSFDRLPGLGDRATRSSALKHAPYRAARKLAAEALSERIWDFWFQAW